MKVDCYPLPKAEDIFATLVGGKVFSKLDLSQAYQQVLLHPDSCKLLTINTQKLFQYTQLPFGVVSLVLDLTVNHMHVLSCNNDPVDVVDVVDADAVAPVDVVDPVDAVDVADAVDVVF